MAENDHRPLENGHGRPMTDAERYDADFKHIREMNMKEQGYIRQLQETVLNLQKAYEQERMDHERERDYNRKKQLEESAYQEKFRRIKLEQERDAYALVLIDGDGLIFNDDLVQRGEAGGREAATRLWSLTQNLLEETAKMPPSYRIMAKVYANLKGLADVSCKTGIIDSRIVYEDFVRGFSSKILFDFVDVGSGKDRADEKITEMFKLNINNLQCKEIIFGCSHDNGYARLLEEFMHQPNCTKLTLLEGPPFEREFSTFLGAIRQTKFEEVFRSSKIQASYWTPHSMVSAAAGAPPTTLTPSSAHASPEIAHVTPFRAVNGTPVNGTNGLPHPVGYEKSVNGPAQRNGSGTVATDTSMQRVASNQSNNANGGTTWAAKASSPAPPPDTVPAPTPSPKDGGILRNRAGQRIDVLGNIDPNEVRRVQKMKLCNVYFLRGDCQYGNDCTHLHQYKPSKAELEALNMVARQVPCWHGTACEEARCIYGHRCPYPKDGSSSKRCIRYDTGCKFAEELHGIDTNIVRTTKV